MNASIAGFDCLCRPYNGWWDCCAKECCPSKQWWCVKERRSNTSSSPTQVVTDPPRQVANATASNDLSIGIDQIIMMEALSGGSAAEIIPTIIMTEAIMNM